MTPGRAGTAALLLALLAPAAAAPLTAAEEAGKRLYFEGESATGSDVTAAVPGDVGSVPAAVLPCAGCHGEDGLGRPEGGVDPSDLRWSSLARRRAPRAGRGGVRPAYDARTLARAIEEGVDAGGRALDPAMPRYAMSRADLEHLVAFLRRLETLRDPGVRPARLRVGTVLPTKGRLREAGAAIEGILRASFEEVNAGGGIHGRRLELAVAGYDSDREDGLAAARRLAADGDVFALVAPLVPRAEAGLAELAEERRLPVVGLLTPFTRDGGEAPSPHVFYVLAGVREQARALAAHAAAALGLDDPAVAIVHGAEAALAAAAADARRELEAGGFTRARERGVRGAAEAEALAAALAGEGVQVVLFLAGDAELSAFARGAERARFAPQLLVPGALAARAATALPAAFDGKLLLAYPTLPGDATAAARARLVALQRRGKLRDGPLAPQVQACAAAAVLAEALKRTGQVVRRERFIENLEALHELDTGLVPKLSFGPNRRVGARGAYVVAYDREAGAFRPVTGWIELR